jgi:hypothetical protein
MKGIFVSVVLLTIGLQIDAQHTRSHRSSVYHSIISERKTDYSLNSETSHTALNNTYSRFSIADPTLLFLQDKANGITNRFYKSPIVGERRHTYGFADGHVILSTSGATSSGTITGSGAVGTGSSTGSLSSNTYLSGVNGKSPYAGPSSWGTAVTGQGININDSSIRTNNNKKKN